MQFVGAGKAAVIFTAAGPVPSFTGSRSNPPTWEQLAAECDSSSNALRELRDALQKPPRQLDRNFTNPFATQPMAPFVSMRRAAQWLAADSLCAMHQGDLALCQTDLHTLTQLIQMHRDDPTLVSAMMRVAISGLALAATWDALQTNGWNDTALLQMQRDWEAIDLALALEQCMVGERAWVGQAFQMNRQASFQDQQKTLTMWAPASTNALADLKDRVVGAGITAYWRGHINEDELFYLRQKQAQIESIRKLTTNGSGVMVSAELQAQLASLQKEQDSPFVRYQHLFTTLAMPNASRATEAVLRNETQRRMTITAVALKRFHLRTKRYPTTLAKLMPQFIATGLMDPWSGKPFHYRPNADGTFTLYSVGEDGRDDGGDPTPAKPSNDPPNMWTGRDAVWPTPVFPDSPAED